MKSCGNFSKPRKSIFNISRQLASQLHILCHNCMGENNIIYDQSLKTHAKNRGLKIKAVIKQDDCFTIFQCKTEEPRNIEISTPSSLEVLLFWCETSIQGNLPPKKLPSKLIIKSTGLKIQLYELRYLNLVDKRPQ